MKLIILLSSFSNSERFHFRKFIRSPYYNEDQGLVELYRVLEHRILKRQEEFVYETIWKDLYPSKKLNKNKLRLKMSYLLKLGEQFLVIHPLSGKDVEYEIKLAEVLSQRKLYKHYATSERKLNERFLDNHTGLHEHAKYNFQYQTVKYNHIRNLEERSGNNNLSSLHESLDVYYIREKLRYYCASLNFQSVRNVHIDIGWSQLVVDGLVASEYLKVRSIQTYYHAYLALNFKEEETFFNQLRKTVRNNFSEFGFDEIFTLYTLLQNICIQQVNAGKSDYLNKLVEVYNDIIQVKLFSEDNKITPWFYKNIITAGLLSSKFDWVNKFIENYSQLLPEIERVNAHTYNLANLHFYKKEYNETITILSKVTFDDVVYELDGRLLLIRSFYELEEWDSLDSLLLSFRLYLLRNKLITSSRKKQYLNLIRYVHRLIKLQKGGKEKLLILKGKLSKEEGVPTKKWLLEKIDELLR